jgi:hypothetical protein
MRGEVVSPRPFDNRGRFIPLDCPLPECSAGKLYYEGDGIWECDGLADPGSTDKELEACAYAHRNGDPWPYRLLTSDERQNG